jgi:LysR family transcriptional activator of nhaA
LTDSGKKILRYADDIFTIGSELEQVIQRGVPNDLQELSIGILNNLSRNFVDGFVAPLLHLDNVKFSLETKSLEGLLKGLTHHDFDLVLTNCTIASFGNRDLWQTQLISQQPVAILGPPEFQPNAPFPNGYNGAKWVLPGPKTEIRSAFESWCTMCQYQPEVKSEADDMAMLRLLARDSGAFAVLPPVVVKDEIESGTLKVFEQIPNAYENFYAIASSKKTHNRLISDLLKSSIKTG